MSIVHVEHLQKMCADNFVSKAVLADKLGMNRDTFYRRLQRGSNFTPEEMRKLRDILLEYGLVVVGD